MTKRGTGEIIGEMIPWLHPISNRCHRRRLPVVPTFVDEFLDVLLLGAGQIGGTSSVSTMMYLSGADDGDLLVAWRDDRRARGRRGGTFLEQGWRCGRSLRECW